MDNKILTKHTESFWHKTGHVDEYPQLTKDLTVDVAVIGGGIAGILAAYQLARRGKSVALIEARKMIYGTTGFTTAKLSAQHDLIYAELIQRYGTKKARSYYDANMAGTKIIREIAEKYGIECELKEEDAYVYTQCESRVKDIEKEAKAYQELAIAGGLVNELPVDLDIKAAVVMHNQYRFHPVLFLAGVLKELEKMDVTIVENTLVTEVKEGDTVLLKTENGKTISCKQAICASHYPVDDPDKFYAKNMKASLSLATVYDFDNSYPGGVYLNSDIPSRTFRSIDVNGKNYLLVGGESHGLGTGTSEIERYESIVNFAVKTFGVKEVIARWSSHDYLTKDRLPFAGLSRPDRKNIFVVTGLNKWGLSNSSIIGELLADMSEGKENAYQEFFNPYREIPDIKESEQEKSKQLSKQKRNPSTSTENVKDLGKEEALTYEKDDKKIGVFKDDDGKLHRLDLKCTHLGCKVSWNDGDETWDCPCHGSRFNSIGEVIEGPAMRPLSNIEEDDNSLR